MVNHFFNRFNSKTHITTRLWQLISGLVCLCVAGWFVWLVYDLVWLGLSSLSWDFITTEPSNSGRNGGIAPILVSTGLIVGTSLLIVIPIGLTSALLLSEKLPPSTKLGLLLRQVLNVLAGVPSIVFGLFGNAFFCYALGLGFSILSGALTLACMVLPYFIRTVEAGLTAIPNTARQNARGLGFSQWGTIRHVLLPIALPSIVLASVLGIARAAAETAALIFTSGYVARSPDSLLDSGRALTVHIYDLAMNIPGGETNASGAALVLLLALLFINLVATAFTQLFQSRSYYS